MSEIPLHGGDGETYTSWQELAVAKPTAFLDAGSFSAEQRAQLVEEMQPYAYPETLKNGDETVTALPSPFEMDRRNDADPLARFAAMNLPRLMPNPDYLGIAEMEAVSVLGRVLDAPGRAGQTHDGFARLLANLENKAKGGGASLSAYVLGQTMVARDGANWRVVEAAEDGSRSGLPLFMLFDNDVAPRLSPLWHATRTLRHIEEARTALRLNDSQRTLVAGLVIGESRKALGIKAIQSERRSQAGTARAVVKAKRDESRDKWLLNRARHHSRSAYYRNNRDAFWKKLETELAEKAVKENWRKIKISRIKEIVGDVFSQHS